MEDKKIQKINHAVNGVNAAVRDVSERLNTVLAGQAFAETDTALDGGGSTIPASQIFTISLGGTGLRGEIPIDSYFILQHPDGSFPISIQNKKSTLAIGTLSIVIHNGGADDQTIYADMPYPVGSLISAVNYTTFDNQFAAGNTTDVQYNLSGQLSSDSNFTYNDGTGTLSATNIVGDLTGDVTGNADTATTATDVTNAKGLTTQIQYNDDGALAGSYLLTFDVGTATLSTINTISTNITGALTGTSSLSNGVTAYNLAISDNSSKVANTKFVHDAIADEDYGVTKIIAGTNVTISPVGGTGDVTINSTGGGGGGTPGGDGSAALIKPIQYNDDGDFAAEQDFYYSPSANVCYSTNFVASGTAASSIYTYGGINAQGDVQSEGNILGNNIGTISDDAIYLTPFDFQANSDSAARPYVTATGATARSYSTYDFLQAGFVVPIGYQATHIDVQAGWASGSSVRTWALTQFEWNTGGYTLHGNYDSNVDEEIMNWNNSVVTPLVGTAGRYWSISWNPQYSSDYIKGVKITIERV